MAQQVFDKSWPLGKNGASELIPGGAILQTRDGKDEPITLSASFQLGEGGLFLPTDKDNPLETRVRELEKLIGEIAANPTPNTLQARLKELADRLGEAVASPNEHTLLARLKAVEEELEAVKDALTSGDAKVTLTGHLPPREVEIIMDSTQQFDEISFVNERSILTADGSWKNYASTANDPIDVSQYKNIHVTVYNALDVGIEFPAGLGIIFGNIPAGRIDRMDEYGIRAGIDDITIPSGSRVNISPINLPVMRNYWMYMTVYIARLATQTSGFIRTVISGERR